MIVYVLMMCRYGDSESHSYVSGVYTSLVSACKEGIEHSEYRANKYEPYIYMIGVDDVKTHNVLARNSNEVKALIESTKTP